MKIGVLGSGMVAKTLANGFLQHGHEVMMGSRDAGKLADWKAAAGAAGSIGSFAETAAYGEIIVLAVKGNHAADVLQLAGAENIAGKTIIDPTNPIADAPPVNGVLQFFTSLDNSLMEQLQVHFPDAYFVKAFSCVGNAFMVNPKFPDGTPSMFICGNNDGAKDQVKTILHQFGWEVEDMGKAEAARAIEPLCILWCIPGMLGQGWTHAFKLLKL